MLFGPDCETDDGLIEDFGLRDIQVEEHGAVSVQGINDVSFALAIDKVREYSSATTPPASPARRPTMTPSATGGVGTEVKCFVELDDLASSVGAPGLHFAFSS